MNADGILKQDDGKKGYSNGGRQVGTKYNPTAQVFELGQIIKSFLNNSFHYVFRKKGKPAITIYRIK